MKVYGLPPVIRAVIFDIDGTLYQHPGYVQHQIDILIQELASARGWTLEAAHKAIAEARAAVAAAQGAQTTSLGNAMAHLGIDMATSVAWRERLIDPSRFIGSDPVLRQSLLRLIDRGLALVALTNNPRSVGEATLQALGVAELFTRVVGLDDTMKSKPAREPFLLAAGGTVPKACLAVGDRYDVDLAVPLELGMGAVLVDGVQDVYLIPELLETT